MQIGLIGCGNMARALARGWGRPVLCFDPVAERARALVQETGGEALASNAEVASRAELVVLCHKPAQLRSIAEEVAPAASAVASILAATSLADVKEAYPGRAGLPLHPLPARRGSPRGRRQVRGRGGEPTATSLTRRAHRGSPSSDRGLDDGRCASCSPNSARSSCSTMPSSTSRPVLCPAPPPTWR